MAVCCDTYSGPPKRPKTWADMQLPASNVPQQQGFGRQMGNKRQRVANWPQDVLHANRFRR